MRAHPHANPYQVRYPSDRPVWSEVFSASQPLDLEIGYANGVWLLSYAHKFPERNIVGIETRRKFLRPVQERIKADGLTNTYVLQANALTAMPELFAPSLLSNVYIFFPDPWYKSRHLKRRVINTEYLNILARYQQSEGLLHVATDRKEFAEEMLAVLASSPDYINTVPDEGFAKENIEGITSEIEQFNLKRDKDIYRMVYRRI